MTVTHLKNDHASNYFGIKMLSKQGVVFKSQLCQTEHLANSYLH